MQHGYLLTKYVSNPQYLYQCLSFVIGGNVCAVILKVAVPHL